MRCNNCGWDNEPGATNCVKCGHSLQVENSYAAPVVPPFGGAPAGQPQNLNYGGGAQMPRPTVVNSAGMQQPPAPKPTVIGASGMQPDAMPRPTRIVNGQQPAMSGPAPEGTRSCPHCGYPVVGDFTSCPNCGAPMGAAPAAPQPAPAAPQPAPAAPKQPAVNLADLGLDENVKCVKCGADVPISYSFCPKCGEKIHLPTVRAIRHKPAVPEAPKPHCSLTLILEEDEVTQERKNEYEGSTISLNRENTEPNNRTITSKEQAELTCEDGKWFLLNKSELGSTYIEANRKFEIQPGDVVVMGDRRFKFEVE